MVPFEDYHRTVVGYHGTRLSVALDIVNRRKPFEASANEGDWLGRGVYFWEYAPRQAERWADQMKLGKKWSEPIAIVGSMIRLGSCLDLLDPLNVRFLKEVYQGLCNDLAKVGRPVPRNFNSRKTLDCAVFEYAYAKLESLGTDRQIAVDTARGVYVPTEDRKRAWPNSWLYEEAHIQICVRNPCCILGTWLHYPTATGDADGPSTRQAAEVGDESETRKGGPAT